MGNSRVPKSVATTPSRHDRMQHAGVAQLLEERIDVRHLASMRVVAGISGGRRVGVVTASSDGITEGVCLRSCLSRSRARRSVGVCRLRLGPRE